jgi:hypothetical protein
MAPSPPRSGLLGVVLPGESGARAIAALSRGALDRPLRCPAELSVEIALDDAVLLGAFQRASSLGVSPGTLLVRRGSGGPEVCVGPGSVHVALALENPASLMACDEKRIVNRYVRPLLRALTRAAGTGSVAHFFGRDWISLAHRPVAWVGFAHDTTTRRTLFEAFVAVRVPFALTPRASFLGRPPATLEALAGAAVDERRLVQAIVDAYAQDEQARALAGVDVPDIEASRWPGAPSSLAPASSLPSLDLDDDLRADPPWAAVVDEAIGPLGAGRDARGAFRVGGDLLVSRDALARLQIGAVATSDDDLGRLVDRTLGAPGVALDGVRSLASVRDVIVAARRGS